MKIVVLGAGITGMGIAEILLREGHDLVMIEKNLAQFQAAEDKLDARVVLGDASSAMVLEPLIDETTDLLIAVANRDDVNIIATLIARKFGVKRAIVRVKHSSNLIHPLLTDDPYVSAINSDISVARDLLTLVVNPTADEAELFANGRVEMLKLHVADDASIISKKLKDIDVPADWIFVARIRDGVFTIADGETDIRKHDQFLLIGDPERTAAIENLLGLHPIKVKRLVIIGYNPISDHLARMLKARSVDVRMIESDPDLARKAAERLNGVLVINGDETSAEVFEQAGVGQAECVVAVTSDEEQNILISLLAKERKVPRVLTLVQKPQYKSVIEKIGIDAAVSPRQAMVDEIIRCIYHQDMTGITMVEGGKGSMIELTIREDNKFIGITLQKIKLPKDTMIGAIIRAEKLILPRGKDELKKDDKVILFSTKAAVGEVKKVFVG